MKNIISTFLILSTFDSYANCKVYAEFSDYVLGSKKHNKILSKVLKKKGYKLSKDESQSDYFLSLNRSTAFYENPGPSLFQSQIDNLDGHFTNMRTAETIRLSSFREVFLLGIRSNHSLRIGIKKALEKLPRCRTKAF